MRGAEQGDVVVIGGRLAGCAVAAPLARAGRRVIVLDRMAFPSDQLSTHVLFPAGVEELACMGALPRILALDPAIVRELSVRAEGAVVTERMRPTAGGHDFGVCVPRDLQDVCLVEAAREQGAEVRERCRFEALHWHAGRVAGVRYRDADGAAREISATLVVGADGRRSSVAAAVGAYAPYRRSRNGRGLVFRYMDEPRSEGRDRGTFIQWRDGSGIAFAFPCTPAGPVARALHGRPRRGRATPAPIPRVIGGASSPSTPALAERIAGVDPSSCTKLRSTAETTAFFRASSGPGWALAGDAGHFKDPVTGQGMRDAMYMGRTLAEHVAAGPRRPRRGRPRDAPLGGRARPPLPARLPLRQRRHAHRGPLARRCASCSAMPAGTRSPISAISSAGRARRRRSPARCGSAGRSAVALLRGERSRRETLRRALGDLRTEIAIGREAARAEFRAADPIAGSEHPGAEMPAPPAVRSGDEAEPEGGVGDEPPSPAAADPDLAVGA